MSKTNNHFQKSRRLLRQSSFQWLLSAIVILAVSFGLWSSVFAGDSQATDNSEFIPVAIHAGKEADYSRDALTYVFRAISPLIVEDILSDEGSTQDENISERVDQFIKKLFVPIPSVIPPTKTIEIIVEHQIIDTTIEENLSSDDPSGENTSDQVDDPIEVIEIIEGFVDRSWPTLVTPIVETIEEFVDRPWPTSVLILEDISLPVEESSAESGVDDDDVNSSGDAGSGDTGGGDTGGGDTGGGDTGGGDSGDDSGGENNAGGGNPNDDKDGSAGDGNAGHGNDDKEKKDKKDKDK